MKYLQNTPHLDPLPSSDEGRGNPAVSVKRTPVCVCERSARFPLPFGRGEDKGEGLLWKTFVSLTKWQNNSSGRLGCFPAHPARRNPVQQQRYVDHPDDLHR